MTPAATLFLVWQIFAICTMVVLAEGRYVGEFSFRGHHASPRGNAIILLVLALVWFISIPAFALLGKWRFGK